MAWDEKDGRVRRSLLYVVAALIFALGVGYSALHPDDERASNNPDNPDLEIETGAGDDGDAQPRE